MEMHLIHKRFVIDKPFIITIFFILLLYDLLTCHGHFLDDYAGAPKATAS